MYLYAAGGAVVLFLLIVTCICCCKRGKSKNNKPIKPRGGPISNPTYTPDGGTVAGDGATKLDGDLYVRNAGDANAEQQLTLGRTRVNSNDRSRKGEYLDTSI